MVNFNLRLHDELDAYTFCIMMMLFLCSNIPSRTARSIGNAMSYYEVASVLVKGVISQGTNITYIERSLKKMFGRNVRKTCKTCKSFSSFASWSHVFAKNLFY